MRILYVSKSPCIGCCAEFTTRCRAYRIGFSSRPCCGVAVLQAARANAIPRPRKAQVPFQDGRIVVTPFVDPRCFCLYHNYDEYAWAGMAGGAACRSRRWGRSRPALNPRQPLPGASSLPARRRCPGSPPRGAAVPNSRTQLTLFHLFKVRLESLFEVATCQRHQFSFPSGP